MIDGVRAETGTGAYVEANEALAGLLGALEGMKSDDALLAELVREFTSLRAKLPVELFSPDVPEPIDPTSPELLRTVVEHARELLMARLTSEAR